MKLFSLLSACILVTVLFEMPSLGQTRGRFAKSKDAAVTQSCPDASLRKIWIKRVGGSGFVSVSVVKVDRDFIYYCLGADKEAKPWSEVQAIQFDLQPESPNEATPNVSPSMDGFSFRKASILPSKPIPHKTFSGTVRLFVELKADETVGEVALLAPLNSPVDELAKQEAKKLVFVPEYRNRLPVSSIELIELTFYTGSLPPGSSTLPIPELIGPKMAEEVPRRVTRLKWYPVPGAVSYKISIFYNEGKSPRYLSHPELAVQAQTTFYDLPYLGHQVNGVKWKIEVLCKDGRKSVSPESYFYYSK